MNNPYSASEERIQDGELRRVSQRVSGISESLTLSIDAKAKAMKSAGDPIIVFGAGEPDFPTPKSIVEAAADACRDHANHKYSPTAGTANLRNAIVAKTKRDSGLVVEPDQVLVTNGGKQAIFEAFATLVDPGDEVILPAPYWTTYPEAIRLAGGVPVIVETSESSGFCVSVDQLEAAYTSRTKAVLFVSPSNPTGAVYDNEATERVARWALKRDVWIIADEIYEHLVYDNYSAPSIPVQVPEARDQCVVLNGVAKSYAMTGWRVGWMIAPRDVIKAAATLQSHMTSNVCNVAQHAAVAALSGDLKSVEEMRKTFDIRRHSIVAMLNDIDGVECEMPRGAFYAYPSVKGLIGKTIDGRTIESSLKLADELLEEAGIAVIPGEAFGTPGYLRLSFALDDSSLTEGVRRFQDFAKRLRS